MATLTPAVTVPLEVYLRTSYHPDRDWIDGELRERNMGDRPHSAMQRFFLKLFFRYEEVHGILAYPELRTQVSATHFRVPDVLVLRKTDPADDIVRVAPLLCIEILSRDDSMSEMQEKIDDYLEMGVAAVWVIDPRRRKASLADAHGLHAREVLEFPGMPIQVTREEMFAELDALESRPSSAV
jgi:Uma2 family endonuclease